MLPYVSSLWSAHASYQDLFELVLEHNISNLEISYLRYDARQDYWIDKIAQHASIAFHNYSIVPKSEFVFNLASDNPDIVERSIKLAKNCIDYSVFYGSTYYAVHAGYLLDPSPSSLGKKLKGIKIPKERAHNNFYRNFDFLREYASVRGVNLLVENNVLTKSNKLLYGDDILMMVGIEDTYSLSEKLACNMLLDIGHLKVSSNTLGFCMSDWCREFDKNIFGYHLSDNDGSSDQNFCLTDKSIFEFLTRKDYLTLEFSYKVPYRDLKLDYDYVIDKWAN